MAALIVLTAIGWYFDTYWNDPGQKLHDKRPFTEMELRNYRYQHESKTQQAIDDFKGGQAGEQHAIDVQGGRLHLTQ